MSWDCMLGNDIQLNWVGESSALLKNWHALSILRHGLACGFEIHVISYPYNNPAFDSQLLVFKLISLKKQISTAQHLDSTLYINFPAIRNTIDGLRTLPGLPPINSLLQALVRDQTAGAKVRVQTLQPCGHIHRVSQDAIPWEKKGTFSAWQNKGGKCKGPGLKQAKHVA